MQVTGCVWRCGVQWHCAVRTAGAAPSAPLRSAAIPMLLCAVISPCERGFHRQSSIWSIDRIWPFIMQAVTAEAGLRLLVPPPALCTDNGAMIAWAGQEVLTLLSSFPCVMLPPVCRSLRTSAVLPAHVACYRLLLLSLQGVPHPPHDSQTDNTVGIAAASAGAGVPAGGHGQPAGHGRAAHGARRLAAAAAPMAAHRGAPPPRRAQVGLKVLHPGDTAAQLLHQTVQLLAFVQLCAPMLADMCQLKAKSPNGLRHMTWMCLALQQEVHGAEEEGHPPQPGGAHCSGAGRAADHRRGQTFCQGLAGAGRFGGATCGSAHRRHSIGARYKGGGPGLRRSARAATVLPTCPLPVIYS